MPVHLFTICNSHTIKWMVINADTDEYESFKDFLKTDCKYNI